MKEPDFVYGIVPAIGEYGFEKQPSCADTSLASRAQKLASSFEWTGLVDSDSVAIAMDPEVPVLVARYTTDPRDPEGRISLLLNVWTMADEFSASDLIDELWPSLKSEVTRQEFLNSSGRRVVGPAGAFVATGFENSWGARSGKSPSSQFQRARPVAKTDWPTDERPSRLFKALAAIMFLLTIGLGVCSYHFYGESTRNNSDSVQYAAERDDLQERLEEAENKIDDQRMEHENQLKKLTAEKSSLKSLVVTKDDEIKRLTQETNQQKKVIESTPEKVDQLEMERLRDFRVAVEERIKSVDEKVREVQEPLDEIKRLLYEKRAGFMDRRKETFKVESKGEND